MTRSRRVTYSTRFSPTVNSLYLRQVADGLVDGPFPGKPNLLGLAVHFALREWRLYR